VYTEIKSFNYEFVDQCSEVNRPVRPGSLRTGTDGKVAVRPRAGRKRCRLFEPGRGRTAMTAN